MSGLLTSPFDYDSNLVEGTVTNVNADKYFCSVRTNKGQYLNQVTWLLPMGGSGKGGIHVVPEIGSQVVINTALTYPIILGCLPRMGIPSSGSTSATGQSVGVDLGNNSDIKGDYSLNPDKPADFVPGDVILATEGGSAIGALVNGSAIVKASTFAQIFLSKFDDLVRVVARNWERFSDVGQQTSANVKGRLYEYLGWDRNLSRSRNGLYELQDVVGDVAVGEVLLGEPNDATSLPAADNRVRKYWLRDGNGANRMVEILYENGKLDLIVQDVAGTTNTREVQDTNKYEVTSTSPTNNSKVSITPTSITLDHKNGTSTVVLDDSAVTTTYGTSTTVVNAASVTSTHGGAVHIVDSAGVRSTFSGHAINLSASGIQMS